MSDYAGLKNDELKKLLKTRGLPTGGNKADLLDRLAKDDAEKSAAGKDDAPAAPAKAATVHPEDEIDWDDDEETAPTTTQAAQPPAEAPITEAAETIAKADGTGQVDNPQAVPNQVADIDPSTTADLAVKEPGEPKEEEKAEPAPDYTRGLAASSIEDEIARRKRRAERFKIDLSKDEAFKALERQARFGEKGPPKALDEALPDRAPRKRGRDTADEGGRGRDKRRGGGRGGPRRGRDDRRRDDRDTRPQDKGRSNNNGTSWMSEADRAKLEERKTRFANKT